jgi:outer membrane protein TolC
MRLRNLDAQIEQARRHVEDGRKIVERQRKRVAAGVAVPSAAELLQQFEQTQAIFEHDLARLINERGGK